MLLSYSQLATRVVEEKAMVGRNGDPINLSQVNSASVDIRLGPNVMIEGDGDLFGPQIKTIDYRARDKLRMTAMAIPEDGFLLGPGDFILAESYEIFNLPHDMSCEYKLKSSMARCGLEHLNAGWCDAGWNGSVLTLELKNMSNFHSILIRAMDLIGQMVFFQHERVPADRSYAARGRYNGDTKVSGIKA